MKNLAIFASGTGSNALNLVKYFQHHSLIKVALLVSNNPASGIFETAKIFGIPALLIKKPSDAGFILAQMNAYTIDYIILAGYLKLIPAELIQIYENRIINIHPALLPAYGGKGMYGSYVHEAVINNKEKASGITIHLADREYDKGKILLQATYTLKDGESPASLATEIHKLEHALFPATVEKYIIEN